MSSSDSEALSKELKIIRQINDLLLPLPHETRQRIVHHVMTRMVSVETEKRKVALPNPTPNKETGSVTG